MPSLAPLNAGHFLPLCLGCLSMVPVCGAIISIRTPASPTPSKIVCHVDACSNRKPHARLRVRELASSHCVSRGSSQFSDFKMKNCGGAKFLICKPNCFPNSCAFRYFGQCESIRGTIVANAGVPPWFLCFAMITSPMRSCTYLKSSSCYFISQHLPVISSHRFPWIILPISVADFESLLPNTFESEGHVFIAPR